MMNELSKKISILAIVSFILLIQGCTDLSGLLSSNSKYSNKPNNSSSSNGGVSKEVRGPTGGGTGSGIIIVDNSGKALKNKKFDLYATENGFKTKLKTGFTDSSGNLDIDEDILSKAQSGDIEFSVDVYDGLTKTVANIEFTEKDT